MKSRKVPASPIDLIVDRKEKLTKKFMSQLVVVAALFAAPLTEVGYISALIHLNGLGLKVRLRIKSYDYNYNYNYN